MLAIKTFCCRNRPFGRFGQQNVLIAKGHRGGRGSRLAKRSGATGEAGLALRRARLDGSAVFGICVCASARFLNLYDLKPAKKASISPCSLRSALLAVQFTLIFPGQPCASRSEGTSRLHERTPALVQRPERVFRLDRRQDLEIVPLALRLGDGLGFEQV